MPDRASIRKTSGNETMKHTEANITRQLQARYGDNDFGKEYRLQIEIAKLRIKTTNSPKKGGKE
jgi:head-tail adaptor